MWEEWDQKIPGGGRYYGITWITIKPDPSNNEFSLTFFSEKCGGGNCRLTVSERKYYFSKVLLLLNLISFFFIYISLWKISKGDNSVCKLEFKWQESKVAMKIFDEQLFHHQFIYPPSLSFQFYLNLAVRNAKGILFCPFRVNYLIQRLENETLCTEELLRNSSIQWLSAMRLFFTKTLFS